jgi:diguanylate cyclase (GGDEF)-like protein/PAS domain S-box-containing protein
VLLPSSALYDASSFADEDGALARQIYGRLGGALFFAAGIVTLLTAWMPASDAIDRFVVSLIGLAAIVVGVVVWFLPWQRWPRTAPLCLIPVAFSLIALHNHYGGADPYRYSIFFIVSFMWIGLGQPRWTSLWFTLPLAVAYLVPLWTTGHLSGQSATSLAYVLPVSILVAESIGWVSDRLKQSQRWLSESETRFRSLVEQVPAAIYSRSLTNRSEWTYASPRIDVLTGRTLAEWQHPESWLSALHPEDRARIDGRWRGCHATRASWREEYRLIRPDGTIVWVRDEADVVYDSTGEPVCWQGMLIDVTEQMTLREKIRHQAFHDPLTGLPNRAYFDERLRGIELADSITGLLFIDLDDFKQINDELGHDAGDDYLIAIAARLRESLRDDDVLVRLGGDEFTILLERLTDAGEAERIAERIMDGLRAPIIIHGQMTFPSASIGIATTASGTFEQPGDLVRAADIAMYRAKQGGKQAYVVFS